MPTRFLRFLAAATLVGFLGTTPATAEPDLAIETSPLAPIFRGAALAARLRPAADSRLAFGAGLYAFTLPQLFVDQIAGNADEGWQVAIRPAVHVSLDYYLAPRGGGLAVGLAVVVARFAISRDDVVGSVAYESLYAVPRISYTQRIWRGLYVTPSIGIELHTKIAGTTRLGDQTFEPLGVQPTIGLQLGYVVSGR